MPDTDNNNTQQSNISIAARSIGKLRLAVFSIAVVIFLSLLHVSAQRGASVKSRGQRGLEAHSATKLIVSAVESPNAGGFYPQWQLTDGRLSFNTSETLPTFRIERRLSHTPADQTDAVLLTGTSMKNKIGYALRHAAPFENFMYLPYAVRNETEGLALLAACEARIGSDADFSNDLSAPDGKGTAGTSDFVRLHAQVQERLRSRYPQLPGDNMLREQFPFLIERIDPQTATGGWVSFVARDPVWMPYPGPFPMTERFMTALLNFDSQLSVHGFGGSR